MFSRIGNLQRYRSMEIETPHASSASSLFLRPTLHQARLHAMLEEGTTINGENNDTTPQHVKDAIGNGEQFNLLLREHPKEALDTLQHGAIRRIGELTHSSVYVRAAFGDCEMLTRGMDTPDDPHFESSWKSLIDKEANYNSYGNRRHLKASDENVTVCAYSVSIQDAAAALDQGLLQALVYSAKHQSLSRHVWDFPAVHAVIQFKWRYWARSYLIIEFFLYSCWLLGFVGFLIIYIGQNLNQDFIDMETDADRARALIAYLCDAGAFVFMIPFVMIEFNAISYYGIDWLNMWNLFDALAYILQVVITFRHMARSQIQTDSYDTILAVQCILLFIKVQYFSRVIDVGASYLETLKILIYKVRYFLLFIVLSAVSASLAFAVLFRADVTDKERKESEDWNADLENFGSVLRSLVTTYAVLFGSFETSYVFDTTNRVVKGIFFVVFQICMSMTVLNLLIAVMTESYADITARQKLTYNRDRAEIIDELEITVPKMLLPKTKPYVHFIVVRKQQPLEYQLSTVRSEGADLVAFASETKSALLRMENIISELKNEVAHLRGNNHQ